MSTIRDFATFETGALIDEEESCLHFIGTYQDLKAVPKMVYHLFEII